MGNEIGIQLIGDVAKISMVESAKRNADEGCKAYGDGAKSAYFFWDTHCYKDGKDVGPKIYKGGKNNKSNKKKYKRNKTNKNNRKY